MPIPQIECPACASPNRRHVPVVHAWNGTAWRHLRCTDCGHRYVDSAPTDAELEMMYDRSYFAEGGAWVCGFWTGSYEQNERALREEAVDALKSLPRKSGTLLEIGPAGGFFMDEARKAGFSVVGVELNQEMVDFGREKLGLEIHQGLFESAPLRPASFDIVVAQDVLEHARDPRSFLQSVAKLLKPNGIFFVRGPLEDTLKEQVYLRARILGRRGDIVLNEPAFHLQGFCKASFARVVESAGLSIETFSAHATIPPWNLRGAKNTASSLIERAAYHSDRVRGRGDFMIASAVKQPG